MNYQIIIFLVLLIIAIAIFIWDYDLRKNREYYLLDIEKDNVIDEARFWRVHRNQSIIKLSCLLLFAIYLSFFTINPNHTLVIFLFGQIHKVYYFIAKRKLLV